MTYEPYPKRDPIKNYFPLPNEVFALDLTAGELAVYSYLLKFDTPFSTVFSRQKSWKKNT